MTGAPCGLDVAALPAARPPDALARQLLDDAGRHGLEALLGRCGLTAGLMKELAQWLLAAELEHHLQRPALQETIKLGNYRNGSTPKTIVTSAGKIELAVPRLRLSTFVPRLVPRYQRSIPNFDHSIVMLYARGLPLHVVQARLLALYGVAAWDELGGMLTGALLAELGRWQARRLAHACALLYCDALAAPARLHVALAQYADGAREVLGMWNATASQGTAWQDIMDELKARGLCAPAALGGPGLPGLREAAARAYPYAAFHPAG